MPTYRSTGEAVDATRRGNQPYYFSPDTVRWFSSRVDHELARQTPTVVDLEEHDLEEQPVWFVVSNRDTHAAASRAHNGGRRYYYCVRVDIDGNLAVDGRQLSTLRAARRRRDQLAAGTVDIEERH